MENKQDSFRYYNPVRVVFGTGCLPDAAAAAVDASVRHVALFCGGSGVRSTGAIEQVRRALPGCRFTEIAGIAPNPDVTAMDRTLGELETVDQVIGIGGGSVLDYAKSCAFLAGRGLRFEDILAGRQPAPRDPGIPFVAVPTTSGTGSEVTCWATIWDHRNKRKHSLAAEAMYPRVAIVDSALTRNLPLFITACTGLDALAHALEAFWSKYANPVSDGHAIEALRLLFANLPRIAENPADMEIRSKLARASLTAGLAFSNTKTTAVHAVSYPMTLHFNVPHGLACFLLLGRFWDYNLPSIPPGKAARLLAAVGETQPQRLSIRIRQLGEVLGLPGSLREVGVTKSDVATIVAEGFHPERMPNNPRELTEENLSAILEDVF